MQTESIVWKFTGMSFNGSDSQIVIPYNPLAGASCFTIEAIFLPEAGGEAEQRFVHVQGNDESRALLELRSTEAGWYADTFVHFSSGERFLNDPGRLHAFGSSHALALTYDGKQLRQYVNGELELEAAAPAGSIGAGSVSLGMRINRVSPFKGQIRKVRFTPEALGPVDLMLPS